MHQFRTDALSIAMIVGGATLAAGATLLLANAGEEAETATRCSHEATAQKVFEEQQRVVVALNGSERSVVVAPTVEISADECTSEVRVADVDVRVQKLEGIQLERAQLERALERAEREQVREAERRVRDAERRIRAQEREVRSEEHELRAQERAVRAKERQERAEERAVRARERALRHLERRGDGEHVVVWEGDEDFDFDFDFDFDHDFDFDFDFDFDEMGFAFEVDGETIVIDLSGLQDLTLALEGLEGEIDLSGLEELSVELDGLDTESEIEERIEEAMRELEERLSEMNRRPGGGF